MADEPELTEDIETVDEEPVFAEDEPGLAEQKRRNGRGPGFLLGIVVGALAGAAAVTLSSPPGDEEGAGFDAPQAGGLLAGLRGRFREARREGAKAARESEEASRARLSELIEKQP